MRILFVGRYDWANVCNRIARAMNDTAGMPSARVFTERAHPLGYEEDMVVEKRTHRYMFEWAATSDWIISTGDGDYNYLAQILDLLPTRDDTRLATTHVGSAYRVRFMDYNAADRALGVSRRFIGGDLYRFALSDSLAVPYFAPPDHVDYDELAGGPVVVSHSPSKRGTKGTDLVLSALEGVAAKVDLIEGVPYAECVARRAKSHIFIDQINTDVGGYGASAVEAMASGCVVIASAHNALIPEIEKFYDLPPIILVKDGKEMREAVDALIADPDHLMDCRRRSLAWARKWASPRAVASYWAKWLS